MNVLEHRADVIVVGAGLAGLVACAELADAGARVLLLDQEPEASLGGQAYWSLGGLFFVDSPEQRRARIRDSFELAWSDWLASAAFDRPEDAWPRRVARAYVEFAAEEKRAWCAARGIRVLPSPGWAERGGGAAGTHGNSVPRFHLTWGTGPGVVAPFEARARAAAEAGLLTFAFRHRVDDLTVEAGTVTGVSGSVLAPSAVARGQASSRTVVGEFRAHAPAVILAGGGIGHNFELVRANWPARLGPPPRRMVAGVPAHVDGRLLELTERRGAGWIGRDRMWHYVEGIRNWNPVWAHHGIRILPAPSSLWLDATGRRLPAPLYPGFDTLATLAHIGQTGYDYTWFILTRKIIEKEFALSGSEQNPDITGRSVLDTVRQRLLPGVPAPIQAFMDRGRDFIVDADLARLVERMNTLVAEDAREVESTAPVLSLEAVRAQIEARDAQLDNRYGKDLQIAAIRAGRAYLPDRIQRIAAPHKLLDPDAGPLIAVKLNILTRKTLGGLHTDLEARVLDAVADPIGGLYAAGEIAGFGGGGMHGYNALEGTFLGGCLFSGRAAGRAVAARL
ncbi:FAD-binding dehydrogenase [Conexibacter sp. DBS9H8]|uniref:FAD-binding dehydrogenase n=1 Tax=Conexibacter sp. DBS9H8 TaxID=2937801 RepID=UPI002010769D|nr:FAD-binding dehydrogenase [Conexibacter sp. DBS9H8]